MNLVYTYVNAVTHIHTENSFTYVSTHIQMYRKNILKCTA